MVDYQGPPINPLTLRYVGLRQLQGHISEHAVVGQDEVL